jgi:hypothetical protein
MPHRQVFAAAARISAVYHSAPRYARYFMLLLTVYAAVRALQRPVVIPRPPLSSLVEKGGRTRSPGYLLHEIKPTVTQADDLREPKAAAAVGARSDDDDDVAAVSAQSKGKEGL